MPHSRLCGIVDVGHTGRMTPVVVRITALRETGALALQALRLWTLRQVLLAALMSIGVAVLIGIATVLIPNPIFARDIPPVWWNYPVWLVTSAMSGMLMVTYLRTDSGSDAGLAVDSASEAAVNGEPAQTGEAGEKRTSRFGLAGGLLAWFAVGCPVCNKLALLALGYTGAITWFAPIQPFLALGALVLTSSALLWRLAGQVACPIPAKVKVQA